MLLLSMPKDIRVVLVAGRRNVFESFRNYVQVYLVSWDLDAVGDEETTEILKLNTLLLQGGLV